ncbi:hypothetical protein GLE_4461 [Lysobacter enzymogenes]|uniref:Uncharacterized protein n=1 Tax=Lysobacter enzymogenes TaxID=69 RepID=A0A0S2DMH2_LYSEN|nr:hypothetical protein GLE_4461 [Lysobacter enzymogenes]
MSAPLSPAAADTCHGRDMAAPARGRGFAPAQRKTAAAGNPGDGRLRRAASAQ